MKSLPIPMLATMLAVLNFTMAVECRAQDVQDNFNDGDDSGWSRYDPFSSATYEFPGGSAYRISTTAPATDTYGPARAGSILSSLTTTDFSISVDLLGWDPTLPQTFGILARTSNVGLGTSTGYMFSYSPGASAGRSNTALAIDRIDNEQVIPGETFNLPGGDLAPEAGYRMTFTGIGDQFSGSLYALSNLDSPLGSVVYTDATYQEGESGLLVADSNVYDLQGATATFDNFAVTAIPEPAHMALFAALFGTIPVLIHRRRNQRES